MKRLQVLSSLVLSLALAGISGNVVQAVAAPTTPGNFQATVSSSSSAVSLTWTASSAPVGIKGYLIERSLDQVTWQTVVGGLQSTSYSDTTVAFGVHYYYRISAIDPTGQASGYAYADLVTNAFSANISASNGGTQFDSPDGIASVTIPANAMPTNAECNVNLIGLSAGANPGAPNHHLVAGPYELLCKTADGTSVVTFAEPIQWQYNLKGSLKGSLNPQPYQYEGNANNPMLPNAIYSASKEALIFPATDDNPTMVLADSSQGGVISFDLMFILLIVGALILGIGLLATKREQKYGYADYIRHKYYNL
jgi:hypothetical protein